MDKNINKLVLMAQKGNADAFGELYGIYAKEMYSYARVMVKNDDLAQDAVQEAVMNAFREIRNLRNPDSFKGWLFRILNIACRKQFTDSVRNLPLNESVDFGNNPGNAGDGGIGGADLSMELREALEILTPEEREIVMLRVVYEYKSCEMAEMLGLPASTVRSKLKRSLEKLRSHMENNIPAGVPC